MDENDYDENIVGILSSREVGFIGDALDEFEDSIVAIVSDSVDENQVLKIFEETGVNHVILVDYFKKVSDNFISKYRGKIFNVHPSLLPKFGGKGMYGRNIHEAVVASGEQKSGATIHIVEGDYDVGKIISQRGVDISGDDVAVVEEKVYDIAGDLVFELIEDILYEDSEE